MIDLIFHLGSEIILVRIEGNRIMLGNTIYGGQMATIDGLQLSYEGVIKEFPDLKGESNWKKEAIFRFKNKINEMKNEDEIAEYIIEDLKKYGYVPKLKQKKGFRMEKIR